MTPQAAVEQVTTEPVLSGPGGFSQSAPTCVPPLARPGTSAERIRSLDGLRAVSISMVMLGHLQGTRGFLDVNLPIGDYARLGVVTFFVISGFLITGLLQAEAETGGISLARFYARRALRLFPAFYVYIGVVLVLWLLGLVSATQRDVWHALTYTVNYQFKHSWHFGHLWSLSIEEQFYLLWPCTFAVLGRSRATYAAAAVIALGPVARTLAWLAGDPYRDIEMFPVIADSLAAGCLLAMTREWLESRRWYLRLFSPFVSIVILGAILLVNRSLSYSPMWVFGTTGVNIGLAVLVHRCIYHSNGHVGWFLNTASMTTIGMLSYSLYLWQQPFLNRSSSAWINAFPQNLICAIVVALASFYLLERPLFELRRKLRRR